MTSTTDIKDNKLRLLSTLELDEVAATIADIFIKQSQAAALAVLIWDQDLESFSVSDRLFFGSKNKEFSNFIEAYVKNFVFDKKPEKLMGVVGSEQKSSGKAGLGTVFQYFIINEDNLSAVILMAIDSSLSLNTDEFAKSVAEYPLSLSLSNAWEVRELKKENERLRKLYEELEDNNHEMKEKLNQVNKDLQAKNALHARMKEIESKVYQISNDVRSSINIEEVLQRTVNNIGQVFQVGHCLLFRFAEFAETEEQKLVYEYCAALLQPIEGKFFENGRYTEGGYKFVQTAMQKKIAHDLGDPKHDAQTLYDPEFLKKLGLRSGYIVPIIFKETILGCIYLHETRSDRVWEFDDVASLVRFADEASVAINNAELNSENERQARMDGLTGLANRRYFNEIFQREFEGAKRYNQPLSLIVFDLDFLKKINDTYGHAAGDEAIKAIARVLKRGSRAIDLAVRYGGEEFCLLLHNADLEMALQVAERLRIQISEENPDILGKGNVQISVSVGIACYPRHANTPEELFAKADSALYLSKQNGRNRVTVSSN